MDRQSLTKKLRKYNKKIDKNFPATLNQIINDLDPSILANEYNPNFSKRIEADPFYELKFEDMNRYEALDKFKKSSDEIVESISYKSLLSLMYYELFLDIKNGNIPNYCFECNKFYFPNSKHKCKKTFKGVGGTL